MLDDLVVFHGDLTAARALVYARLALPDGEGGWSLSGYVRGPRCLHAETLPLTTPLVDMGPGKTLLAKASIPDPVFWSPDLPAIYDVNVNLLLGAEIIASERREIGLRSLGVRGRDLFLGGKKWVLRGVSVRSTPPTRPWAWHAESAAYIAEDTDVEALDEASQWGALSVVPVSAANADSQLRALSRFPAAAIALFGDTLPADLEPRNVAPNSLIARMIGSDNLTPIDPRIDLLVADAQWLATRTLPATLDKPVIASRRLPSPVDLAQARAACDRLQRDLAPLGQFAGYIV